jgi:hypothetical protein
MQSGIYAMCNWGVEVNLFALEIFWRKAYAFHIRTLQINPLRTLQKELSDAAQDEMQERTSKGNPGS